MEGDLINYDQLPCLRSQELLNCFGPSSQDAGPDDLRLIVLTSNNLTQFLQRDKML